MVTVRDMAYGATGFALSLITAVLMAAGMQILLVSAWHAKLNFLVIYGATVAIAIVALVCTWVGLLHFVRNKAMVRGVWCFMYALIVFAVINLILALIP